MTDKKQKIVQVVVIALITIIVGTGLIVKSNAGSDGCLYEFLSGNLW